MIEAAELHRHVDACPDCKERFQLLKALSRDLEELPNVKPPYSLVDAILPQLDAADLARKPKPDEEEDQHLVMMPQLSRSSRRASWWNTVAGRAVIGTTAAAVILGVAIFNYDPKMLSDAEIVFDDETVVTTNNTTGSGADKSGGELFKTSEQEPAEALENQAATDEETNREEAELFTAETPNEKQPASQPKESPNNSMDARSPEKAPAAGAETPEIAAPNRQEGSSPAADSKSPVTDGQGSNSSENTSEMGAAPAPESNPDTASPAPNPDASASSEDLPTAQRVEEPAEGEQNPEMMTLHISNFIAPEMWDSPNGLYSASLEIDTLVIYRLPVSEEQLPAVLESIPFKGEWQHGEWSEDSSVFTYTVMAEGQEVKLTYKVPSDPAEKESAESQTKPKEGKIEGNSGAGNSAKP